MKDEVIKKWFDSELSELPFEPVFGMVLFSDGVCFGHGKIGDLNVLGEMDRLDLAMQLRKFADELDGGYASEKFFTEQKKLDDMIANI